MHCAVKIFLFGATSLWSGATSLRFRWGDFMITWATSPASPTFVMIAPLENLEKKDMAWISIYKASSLSFDDKMSTGLLSQFRLLELRWKFPVRVLNLYFCGDSAVRRDFSLTFCVTDQNLDPPTFIISFYPGEPPNDILRPLNVQARQKETTVEVNKLYFWLLLKL